MKRIALSILLLIATFAPAVAAPDEYNLDVHVSSSFLIFGEGRCARAKCGD
jgi:hypothetical protein